MNPHIHVPTTLDHAADMFFFLDKIGLPLPTAARAMAAEGLSLSAAGVHFTEAKIDDALDKFEIPSEERIRVKLAAYRHGLMRKAA